ncbi:hypothetical protein KO500_11070 [Cellulophaga baltica]|uniref:DUF6588 family protein n=1 Tax=Cellulophaga TaxID=104264 RepID=UPI001C06C0B2|nr:MULTISPECIES: DUF6588 family protein [Cellulophaga]MBU2996979.1 hypothetical protein [Cellulophaga baltica]MDO6768377.1 hypothetical protein [Cellulophaga sp. 1_MG-2023]
MKSILFFVLLLCSTLLMSQANINEVFAAGVDDAERFTNDYMAPVSEGLIYSISNGWYNSASSKPLAGFEISIIANGASFKNNEDKKAFVLNTADYDNLQFVDGSTSKSVSTGLGDIENVMVYVEDENGLFREEFELPTGLASENINFVPSAFVQVSVGLIKGFEVKARFLPKIDTDNASMGFYGVGLQHEFTSLLPLEKVWPIAISGVIGYTHLDGSYDFTDTGIVSGEDQRIETDVNTWVFQAVVSTKMPIINFYGGIGYLTGKSETDVLGTYEVTSGPFQQTITDPFSLTKEASGVTANIGTKLKLGFFRLHADYAIAEFNSLSVGVNFGFR